MKPLPKFIKVDFKEEVRIAVLKSPLGPLDGSANENESVRENQFYSDFGPEDNWDEPLKAVAKEFSKPRQHQNQKRHKSDNKPTRMTESFLPSQALITASQTRNLITEITTAVEKRNKNPTYIDQLNSLRKKQPMDDKDKDDDNDHAFDFRAVLRKTNFAPTASLRKRKNRNATNTNEMKAEEAEQEIPSLPILRKVSPLPSPALHDAEPMFDDAASVVDL